MLPLYKADKFIHRGDKMDKEVAFRPLILMLAVYMGIGIVFGFITIMQTIWMVYKEGKDKTSKKILNLEHGGDYGSTILSIFGFPLMFSIVAWPLLVMDWLGYGPSDEENPL